VDEEAGPEQRVLALAGPTATGKSEVALCLAEELNGEIVSVDSMQVYRGLDIGTAKPTAAERERVRHHLIDVAELATPFDVAQFLTLARQAVADITSRGRLPILCGGTGLYFKAFFEGLGQAPPACNTLRAELERTPLATLLQELAERDPVTYERIDRQNARRVVRALEVIRLTGRPYSLQRAAWSQPGAGAGERQVVFGLRRSASDLHERIEARVDAMFRQGLVSETKALLAAGLEGNRVARQALGYRQVAEYLRGERSLVETIALVKIRTRQFAKRQMTWFRRQMTVQWLDMEVSDAAPQLAARISEFHRGRPRLKNLSPHQDPQDQQNKKNRHEKEKQELGDIRGRAGDTRETQQRGNDRDDEENGSPP
jgi:tRNA dimethylallyltransferase